MSDAKDEQWTRETAPKPLRAFYGASDRLKRANTVKSMACPGERPQQILTPQAVLDMLPWPVQLDPCACDGSLVQARVRYFGPARHMDGLIMPWADRTYCNPPYKYLHAWLDKAAYEAGCVDDYWHMRPPRIIMLAPVRTHRRWFREHVFAPGVYVRWLDPITFVGYTQAFPAPLCLISWNGGLT